MSMPLGHAAFGITIAELATGEKVPELTWKHYLFFVFLANLPDMDVVFGLLFHGNANAFHRGITHSLLFSFIAAFAAARCWKLFLKSTPIELRVCFLVIFSHIAADFLFTGSPVSLFWPFENYNSGGQNGWFDTINILFLKAYRDAAVIACSALIFSLTRWLRQPGALLLIPGTKIPSS